MMLLRLLENWNGADRGALKRYYRDENLSVHLEKHLILERESASNLERTLYAARSYFAA